jgi:hypothetical protein
MGSAYKNKGVQLLLDGVTDYLPAPLEVVNEGLDLNNDEQKLRVGGSPGACPNSKHTHVRSSKLHGCMRATIVVVGIIACRVLWQWNTGSRLTSLVVQNRTSNGI